MPTDRVFRDFEEFWPYYLGEHALALNRWLHFGGTTAVLLTAAAAVLTLNPYLFLALPIVGYGPAWIGHFIIERNRPATFQHPLWSLRGDFRMYGMMWRGRLRRGNSVVTTPADRAG
ncbi:MAG: DUF962 domain-containing protein [Pseudomonadota bacterium]|nr:DUF962 domain-containing protein [Pseudomonadota bacterium]